MLEFKGHHVVSSSTGRRVLFAAFKHLLVVGDIAGGTRSATLETTFDFGGRRLALSDELDAALAAAYHVHGLALYSCSDGRELWRRKDLKKVQKITLSRDGLTAYCGREGASLAVVDLRTGHTERVVRGARALHDSRYDDVQFLDGTKPQVLENAGRRRCFVDRTTFAFLDVTFAPGLLAVSESGGPVRCLDIAAGHERWRYQPTAGRHVLRLGDREAERSLLGVEWPFEKGGAKRLLRWSIDSGVLIDAQEIGGPIECCFALDGEVMATAGGEVLEVATGARRRWMIA